MEKKGTVTSLSSVFPPEEAQKASKRVLDTIADRQKELNQLQHFITDNNNLLNLVQQIPEQLHHDIMVPFGKAAFFPGRLIHTNEFLVLLGEGYYADRTSKQTSDILKRRGNALESQVESLKAVMQDLKVEASFFDATASEAAEGLVEIREDYIEDAFLEKDLPADNKRATVEDEEYACLLSRMDELEKEELEAENFDEYDELDEVDLKHQPSQFSGDHEVKNIEMDLLSDSLVESKDVHSTTKLEDHLEQDFRNQLAREASKVQPASKVSASLPKSDGYPQVAHTVSSKSSVSEKEPKSNRQEQPRPKSEGSVLCHETRSNSSKAFTGSIVEHTRNMDSNPSEQAAASTSKPISRFKMQRRQQ